MHQDEPLAISMLLAKNWYAVFVDVDCTLPSSDGFNVLQLFKFGWVMGALLLYPLLKGLCMVVDRKAGAKVVPLPLLLFIVC